MPSTTNVSNSNLTQARCTRYNIIQLLPALKVNIIIVHPRGVVFSRALARGKTTSQMLLYRNYIYNNVEYNKHLYINFIFVFLTSGQDCNSGMEKRMHFRTDMEHNMCRPVINSDVCLRYQFCKNITFILYIM
jgi:hypothetical protein